MNAALRRIILYGPEFPCAWIPFARLRPHSQEAFTPGLVALRTVAGVAWAGLPILVLTRLLLGHWSLAAFLAPGALGGLASLMLSLMLASAWNQRAVTLRQSEAAGLPLPAAPTLTTFDRVVLTPLLALAVSVVALGLVITAENLRGTLAWRAFEQELRAKGAPVTLAEILPPAVPPEKNLAESPLFKPMLDVEPFNPRGHTSVNAPRWRDPAGWERVQRIFVFEDPKTSYAGFVAQAERSRKRSSKTQADRPAPTNSSPSAHETLSTGTRVNLERWQHYYQSLPNWPKPTPSTSAARDVLAALSGSDAELQALRTAAAERPEGSFPVRYEEGPAMLLPQLATLKRTAQFLRLRAVALLADNRADDALADVRLAYRCSDLLADEPILISQLVRFALDQIALQPVWEGCLDQRWNDAQLAALQTQLAHRNPVAGLRRALDGERLWVGVTYDQLAQHHALSRSSLPVDSQDAASTLRAITACMPRGWVRQSQVVHGRYLQSLAENLDRAHAHAQINPWDESIGNFVDRGSPVTLFAGMLIPAVGRAADHAFEAEAWRRLALVGLALERHRLARHEYPEALASLAPAYLQEVPLDPMDGRPLRYQRLPDGGFTLYSVGLDHVDNAGRRTAPATTGNLTTRNGTDLTWR